MPDPSRGDRGSGAEKHDRARVRVCWTGKGSAERVEKVPITPRTGAKPAVALSLGPAEDADASLPDLTGGDRLEISAELEVTTDLTVKQAEENARDGGRPAGEPYDYAPAIKADLILAPSPDIMKAGISGAKAIGRGLRIKLNHEQHHAVLVFDGARLDVPPAGPGWDGDCYVNLVISASHEDARSGQVLLVGQNEFNGTVEGDMASLCAIRSRPARQSAPDPQVTEKVLVSSMPLQGDVKRVIYSQPLERLRANEQLRIRADVRASANALGYSGRLKTRVFLADKPEQVEPDGKSHAASVAAASAHITKGNGFNCLPKSEVVTFSKVGVARILKDSKRTIYVNVVGVAGDPEKKGQPDSLRILSGGRLSVVRYPATSYG